MVALFAQMVISILHELEFGLTAGSTVIEQIMLHTACGFVKIRLNQAGTGSLGRLVGEAKTELMLW